MINITKTGNFWIDAATNGGLHPGGVCEVYGYPKSGKTSLLVNSALQGLMNGEKVVFVDNNREITKSSISRFTDNPNFVDSLLSSNLILNGGCIESFITLLNADKIDMIVIDNLNVSTNGIRLPIILMEEVIKNNKKMLISINSTKKAMDYSAPLFKYIAMASVVINLHNLKHNTFEITKNLYGPVIKVGNI